MGCRASDSSTKWPTTTPLGGIGGASSRQSCGLVTPRVGVAARPQKKASQCFCTARDRVCLFNRCLLYMGQDASLLRSLAAAWPRKGILAKASWPRLACQAPNAMYGHCVLSRRTRTCRGPEFVSFHTQRPRLSSCAPNQDGSPRTCAIGLRASALHGPDSQNPTAPPPRVGEQRHLLLGGGGRVAV